MHLVCEGVACAISGRTIVSDVNVSVPRGAVFGLVGVNGSGKSTLLKALAGLRPPTAGTVTVDGREVAGVKPRERATMVAYVGQEETPPEDLLLGEMVAMGRIPHRSPWAADRESDRRIVLQALRDVGMDHAADRRCDRLSGGERRRAMLARGLAQQAGLLILDEPTNHLDIHHQIHLLETLRTLGRTVIVALHDLSLAATFCDRVAVLDGGRLRVAGPAEEALSPEVVESVFSVPAIRLTDHGATRSHLVLGPGTPTGGTGHHSTAEALISPDYEGRR